MSNVKWLDFINGINSLMIKNEKDFEEFKNFICDIGLKDYLNNQTEFSDWQHLSIINNCNPDCIIFEIQPGKGLSFGYTEEESKNWFGENPLNVSIFESFYENSQLAKDIVKLSTVYNNTYDYVMKNWYEMGYSSEKTAIEDFGLDICDENLEMGIN